MVCLRVYYYNTFNIITNAVNATSFRSMARVLFFAISRPFRIALVEIAILEIPILQKCCEIKV